MSIPIRVLEAVRARKDEWVSLLVALASLESPTTEPSAQGPVQDLLSERLTGLGYRVRRVRGVSTGGSILAVPSARKRHNFQLLLGHTDTVWPRGTLDTMPVDHSGPVLKGPGVFDMKSGLTNAVIALRVLRELGLEPGLPPVVLFNSDEEMGSPESTSLIQRLGRSAARVFVLEPALGLEGKIKTARKGTGRFTVRIVGRAAHAGLDPEQGASAIQELALVVQSLHDLTDFEDGVVVNVGEVQGGVRYNVVAAEARAEVDVRVRSLAQGREVEARIRAIGARVRGCRIEIEGRLDRPPLERTQRNQLLWQEARRVGDGMGIRLVEGIAGGASDGNTTSDLTATLDGLGGVGDGAHALHEHIDVDRSIERCALLAVLLLMPPGSGDPGGLDPMEDKNAEG